jgi:chorismate mutase/prephenate dehydratase
LQGSVPQQRELMTVKPTIQTPAQLAREIGKLDRQLLKLMQERANAYERWSAAHDDLPNWDDFSERQQLDSLAARSKGPLDGEALRTVFRELISGCRQLREPLRICYLGPAYSYSHLAAVRKFGENATLVPVATIKAVFEEVNAGACKLGLVPIENSTDGRIVDTLGMFARQLRAGRSQRDSQQAPGDLPMPRLAG